MPIRSLADITPLRGTTVMVRASLNVPIDNGAVRNQYRLQHAIPTIQYLQNAGAKVVVIGHIGRTIEDTLYPVYEALAQTIAIRWGGSVTDPAFKQTVATLAEGEAILAENLRHDSREHDNDAAFAQYLASLADVYVNDAFANMHREHASMVGVPKYLPGYAGLRVQAEVAGLAAAMEPHTPSLFILGGAKFETKLALVDKYRSVYDELFIGGALAHDVLRARGYEVGQSLVSDQPLANQQIIADSRISIPLDVVALRQDKTVAVLAIDEVTPTDTIFDCGPATIEHLCQKIRVAQSVLWNGPLGNYEAGYDTGTKAVATALADSTANSFVGGGDTVAAIEAIHRSDDFTFISTGGGAMLTYLEHGTLPALDCLDR